MNCRGKRLFLETPLGLFFLTRKQSFDSTPIPVPSYLPSTFRGSNAPNTETSRLVTFLQNYHLSQRGSRCFSIHQQEIVGST